MPTGYRCIIRDVSDRYHAERELARQRTRLEAIFRSVKDAIITVDTAMTVIEANASAERICGLPADRMVHRDFTLRHCCGACREVLAETFEKKTAVREFQVECNHRNSVRNLTKSPSM